MADEVKVLSPQRLPDDNHIVVVALENTHPVPTDMDLPLGRTSEVLIYQHSTAEDDVAARVQCATVVVTTTCPINAATLGEAPHL